MVSIARIPEADDTVRNVTEVVPRNPEVKDKVIDMTEEPITSFCRLSPCMGGHYEDGQHRYAELNATHCLEKKYC